MEEVLSSDPTRGNRHDFPLRRPGKTAFVLLLYLGHIMDLTGVIMNLVYTTKVKFLLGYINPERCLADQGQAFRKMSVSFS